MNPTSDVLLVFKDIMVSRTPNSSKKLSKKNEISSNKDNVASSAKRKPIALSDKKKKFDEEAEWSDDFMLSPKKSKQGPTDSIRAISPSGRVSRPESPSW